MTRETSSGSRDLWLPALVVVLGGSLSAGLWWNLVEDRHREILESTGELARDAQHLVATGVQSHLVVLGELTRLWAAEGLRRPGHFQEDVERLIRNFPAFEHVAWVDADTGAVRVAPGAPEVDRAALQRLAEAPQPALVRPERDAGGAPHMLLPVRAEGGDLFVSRVDLDTLLRETLRGGSTGYAVRVRWGDTEIFSRGRPSEDPWQAWWRVETRVELPHGVVWSLLLRPTPELTASRLTPVPHYLLLSGLLLSLLLAALAHQLRLTLRQSRFLAASNRAHEERGHELERRVADRTAELEAAVAELRTFNQTVSHDLRSPLGAVLNFATILEQDHRGRPLDAEGLAIVERIRRSASRATALLEGLARLSRAGRAALELTSVDMVGLAKETFAQVRVAEEDADVELVVEDLPPVPGDRALLGDVFANLFTNALKYSRGCEKRRITVRGAVDDEHCVYAVADNGRGIDMRFGDKLFEMFERLDSEDDVEGTGVGLAIVERIVRRHDGRVWAESRPGEGARFFFALPRVQAGTP